jgi:hypothetical protein
MGARTLIPTRTTGSMRSPVRGMVLRPSSFGNGGRFYRRALHIVGNQLPVVEEVDPAMYSAVATV